MVDEKTHPYVLVLGRVIWIPFFIHHSNGPVRQTSTTTEKPRKQTITQKPRRRTSTMKPTFEDILGRQPFSTKRPSNRGRPPTFTENPPKM